MLRDFFSLICPQSCACCGNNLYRNETLICTHCIYHLPETDFHHDEDNPVSRLFRGRAQVEAACAYLSFNKGSRVQTLIHKLKYKGRQEIGHYLGYRYGLLLRNSPLFQTVNYIVPVPLHPQKQRQRGYNQSEIIARGLSSSMKILLETTTLVRTKPTETQTRKSRFKRWENVKDIFVVTRTDLFADRHILLVDDVITTGATLEACILALSGVPGCRISVAAIAASLI